jgi:hypothetical protein
MMNLRNESEENNMMKYGREFDQRSYMIGHRDARHSAAEATLRHDHYIERLEYYVRKMAGDEILKEIQADVGVL